MYKDDLQENRWNNIPWKNDFQGKTFVTPSDRYGENPYLNNSFNTKQTSDKYGENPYLTNSSKQTSDKYGENPYLHRFKIKQPPHSCREIIEHFKNCPECSSNLDKYSFDGLMKNVLTNTLYTSIASVIIGVIVAVIITILITRLK